MSHEKIKLRAEFDVDCGNGMQTKEEFFLFLDSLGLEHLDKYYRYYVRCYKAMIDLLCEWASDFAACMD
jgi:hypothetical protein